MSASGEVVTVDERIEERASNSRSVSRGDRNLLKPTGEQVCSPVVVSSGRSKSGDHEFSIAESFVHVVQHLTELLGVRCNA